MKLKILDKLSRFLKFTTNDYTGRRTNSFWFLLPMLKLDQNLLLNHELVNVYLADHTSQYQYCNSLHLLFKCNKYSQSFNKYLYGLTQHPEYITHYDTYGEGNLMVVFNIPQEYLNVLELFKSGKYSEFPDNYKELFPKKNNLGQWRTRWKVFLKHEDLRKAAEEKINIPGDRNPIILPQTAEVWDKPIPKQEVYKYNENIKILW